MRILGSHVILGAARSNARPPDGVRVQPAGPGGATPPPATRDGRRMDPTIPERDELLISEAKAIGGNFVPKDLLAEDDGAQT